MSPRRNRLKWQSAIARSARWLAFLAIPLVINGAIWKVLVVPQQTQLREWQQTQALAQLKPKLETALTQSHQLLGEWERMTFTAEDPTAVTQAIRKRAAQHDVQLVTINSKPSSPRKAKGLSDTPVPGFTAMPIDLAVTGRFNKLMEWIRDLEAQTGLRVDSWELTSEEKPGHPHQLTMTITALLRES